jgi:hypothetical protein
MPFVYAVLAIAVLFSIGWFVRRVSGVALIGVNRVVFGREYRRDKKLREGMTFHTTASVAAVLRELDAHVCAVEAPLGFSDVLYVASRSDRGIAWAYGSASTVKLEAAVALSVQGTDTEGVFAVTRWREEHGLEVAVDALKQLRACVVAAFQAADPDVVITEGVASPVKLERFDGSLETTE